MYRGINSPLQADMRCMY